jgi:lipopolysaccharide export system ATP-binding protein
MALEKDEEERIRFMSGEELDEYLLETELRYERENLSGEDAAVPENVVEDRRKPKPGANTDSQKNRLSVSGLKKSFGRKHVVKGVGFYLRGGDIAGLLGPNGAGKTTIFYMIVGFLRPSEGMVKLNQHDITTGPMYRRARLGIAYLPQEASIFRKLTVEQNIYAVLETRRDLSKAEKLQKMEELIDDFGIDRIRTQAGYTLSGGERRRTEIARALAIEPKFLLLDEPFAGIDPIAVYDIKQIILKLANRGIGVLITDHNVRDTLEITDDAFIISDGTIVARGTKEMILNNQMVRDIYLGADFKM